MTTPDAVAIAPAASLRVGWSMRAACCATLIMLALAVSLVWLLTDRPLWASPVRAGAASRAAFAIRDLVPAFQQWGSRSFTVPNLQSAYGEVDYVTITGPAAEQRDECVRRLSHLLQTHEAVDLFLLAHSNSFVDWVAALDPALRDRLRFVYNTGCFDLQQRQRWLDLGARSYVGHVGLSESPIFYVFFLRRWLRGEPLGEVVAASNDLTGVVMNHWWQGLQFNSRATAASTYAEITGDATLRIDGARR